MNESKEDYAKNIHSHDRNGTPNFLLREKNANGKTFVVFDDFINVILLKEPEKVKYIEYIELYQGQYEHIFRTDQLLEILDNQNNKEEFERISQLSQSVNRETLGLIQSRNEI